MEAPQEDIGIRTIRDLVHVVRQNKADFLKGAVGSAIGVTIGALAYIFADLQEQRIETLQELTDEQAKYIESLRADNQELIDGIEANRDDYTPCNRKDQRELEIAQRWVQAHLSDTRELALVSCHTYQECPLTTSKEEMGFVYGLNDVVYGTQFFCPTFDNMTETSTALASIAPDQDPDRIAQMKIRPELLEEAKDNPCELVLAEVHEWIHIAANYSHDQSTDAIDWPYLMGIKAYWMCMENPPMEWIGKIPSDAAPY